jgi:hypothetical protein
MKGVFLALVSVCMTVNSGCTTLQPAEATPDELQRLILSEGILEPGQRVRLVTRDKAVHEFRVTVVDSEKGVVHGKDESVPIGDIVAIETREISAGRTALLTRGLVYSAGIVIAIALAPAAILGGS